MYSFWLLLWPLNIDEKWNGLSRVQLEFYVKNVIFNWPKYISWPLFEFFLIRRPFLIVRRYLQNKNISTMLCQSLLLRLFEVLLELLKGFPSTRRPAS